MSVEVEPRRRPATRAGAAIVDAVLEAAALLLERDGCDALTTNSVARVAGVSIGSLYQYFPSKEAIVVGLARRIEERGRALAMERASAIDASDPREVTAAFVSVMLDPRLGSPATRRALLLEVPPASILEATRATDQNVETLLVEVIEALGPALRPARPELMSFVAFHAVEGVVEEALLDAPALLSEPSFHAELHRLAWAYAARDGADLRPRVPEAVLASPPSELPEVRARFASEPARRRPDGEPRERPTTARGRATVDAVLSAMADALAEVGWTGISAREVARRAGVGKGTLYRYFPDLRAIVAELARRREAGAFERIAAELGAEPADALHVVARRAIEATITANRLDPGVRQALLSQVPPRFTRPVSVPVNRALRELVAAHLARGRLAAGRAHPEVVAFVTAHAVERVIEAAVLQRREWLASPEAASELASELDIMTARYLHGA